MPVVVEPRAVTRAKLGEYNSGLTGKQFFGDAYFRGPCAQNSVSDKTIDSFRNYPGVDAVQGRLEIAGRDNADVVEEWLDKPADLGTEGRLHQTGAGREEDGGMIGVTRLESARQVLCREEAEVAVDGNNLGFLMEMVN